MQLRTAYSTYTTVTVSVVSVFFASRLELRWKIIDILSVIVCVCVSRRPFGPSVVREMSFFVMLYLLNGRF